MALIIVCVKTSSCCSGLRDSISTLVKGPVKGVSERFTLVEGVEVSGLLVLHFLHKFI